MDFAWRWMELTAGLDADPFVDTRTGILTGEATDAYFARLEGVLAGKETVPPRLVDNLGPIVGSSEPVRGSYFLPAVSARLDGRSFGHPAGKLSHDDVLLMATAGLLHLGGHGDPAGVLGGMQAADWSQLPLAPAFLFNGCCFGGVTDSSPSFCLATLRSRPLAYFASLYPDHGMPVYQEIDRLALTGGSAGDLIKGTQDEVILALGASRPRLPHLEPGVTPSWTVSQTMLYGTASRVLFGDPSVRLKIPAVGSPFKLLERDAVLLDAGLPATLTDTFHGDLCSTPNMFNARALLEWPASRGKLTGVEVLVWGKKLRSRVVGAAVEDGRVLRVQVDIESTGLFRSPFFVPGATVRCRFAPQRGPRSPG